MLVTNILLGIVIVVLFAILDRLGDIFYHQPNEATIITVLDEMNRFLDKLIRKD